MKKILGIFILLFSFSFLLFSLTDAQTTGQQNNAICSDKFFALGDSIASEYHDGIGHGGGGANGVLIGPPAISNGLYQSGASPSTILVFTKDQSKLGRAQLDYIKRNGVAIFSGTNNTSQQNAVRDTVQYLLDVGIPTDKIYLSNVLISVSGSGSFNAFINTLVNEKHINKIDISLLPHDDRLPSGARDNDHPDIVPFRNFMQATHSGVSCTDSGSTQPTLPTQTNPNSAAPSSQSYNRNLGYGSSGPEVTSLQNFLISNNYSIPAGATGNFRDQTQSALAQMQRDALNTYYAGNTNNQFLYGLGQALNSQGYTPSDMSGYFGDTTRNYLNGQIASGQTSLQPFSNPNLYGGLSVEEAQRQLIDHGYTIPSNEVGVGGPVTQERFNQLYSGTPPLPEIYSFDTAGTQGGVPYNANQTAVNPSTNTTGNVSSPSGCYHPSSLPSGGRTYNVRITSYRPGEPGSTGNTALTGENLANYDDEIWTDNNPYACKNIGMAAVDPQMIAKGSLIAVRTPDGKYYFYKAGDTGGDVKNRQTSRCIQQPSTSGLNTNNPAETCGQGYTSGGERCTDSPRTYARSGNICQFLPVVDLFMSHNINPYNTQIIVYPPGTH